MPRELEALYQDMWRRLNDDEPIYRRKAAEYFRLAMATGFSMDNVNWATYSDQVKQLDLGLGQPVLLGFMITRGLDEGKVLDSDETSLSYLQQQLELIKTDINNRCAGLLELQNLPALENGIEHPFYCKLLTRVKFMHRTAYDFMRDTVDGQKILSHAPDSLGNVNIRWVRLWLDSARICYQLGTSSWDVSYPIKFLVAESSGIRRLRANRAQITSILTILETLYDKGVLSYGHLAPCLPKVPLGSILAEHRQFHDFVLSRTAAGGKRQATEILRNLRFAELIKHHQPPDIAEGLITMGADPVAMGFVKHPTPVYGTHPFFRWGSALTELLLQNANIHSPISTHSPSRSSTTISKWLAAMNPSMSTLDTTVLLVVDFDLIDKPDFTRLARFEAVLALPAAGHRLVMQMELRHLVSFLVQATEKHSQFGSSGQTASKMPVALPLFVLFMANNIEAQGKLYRILDPDIFLKAKPSTILLGNDLQPVHTRTTYLESLLKDPQIAQQVDLISTIYDISQGSNTSAVGSVAEAVEFDSIRGMNEEVFNSMKLRNFTIGRRS
ncbi:hypothetical protein HJFPF1_02189 [Paramyrothecium foliicola]|nr:hypothetical protein HJFPF1_02189 [Paramyrothecium foliicola]